jgi:drug/metabolite transporter (DMT)-like permease
MPTLPGSCPCLLGLLITLSGMSMHRWSGFLLVIVSAISYGTMAIFVRLAYMAGANPVAVLFLRFSIAAGVLLLLMIARRTPFPRGRTLFGLFLMGALIHVGQSLTYFTALTMASATLVTLLVYLYPALVAALAVLFLGERLTLVKLGALLLAITGTALTIGPAGSGGRPLGIMLAIASAVIYAIYIVIGSRITRCAGAIPSATIIILSAAIVYACIFAVRGAILPTTRIGWAAIVAVALVSTVLAVVTLFAGLERIGPTSTSTLSALEPAVTITLAIIFLKEKINLFQFIGGALILSAVLILARSIITESPSNPAPISEI